MASNQSVKKTNARKHENLTTMFCKECKMIAVIFPFIDRCKTPAWVIKTHKHIYVPL
jgi:hypothetical protein